MILVDKFKEKLKNKDDNVSQIYGLYRKQIGSVQFMRKLIYANPLIFYILSHITTQYLNKGKQYVVSQY